MPDPYARLEDAPNMAIFCDFENVAIGAQRANYETLDIRLVLERLLDKGNIVVKKAYADWERYKQHKRPMHEAAFELIEIPHVSYSGKNSADIRLVVDALDLCYMKEHVDVFVIVSGDSDFSPLVSKLRENNKRVIGVGVKSSTSDLLIDNCDEFIYYDDLARERREAQRKDLAHERARTSTQRAEGIRGEPARSRPDAKTKGEVAKSEVAKSEVAKSEAAKSEAAKSEAAKSEPRPHEHEPSAATETKTLEERQREAIELVLDVVEALFQDRDGALHGALVKQTLKRKRPEFSERFHGYRTFNQLLEDAGRRGLLEITRNASSGGYQVIAFGPNA